MDIDDFLDNSVGSSAKSESVPTDHNAMVTDIDVALTQLQNDFEKSVQTKEFESAVNSYLKLKQLSLEHTEQSFSRQASIQQLLMKNYDDLTKLVVQLEQHVMVSEKEILELLELASKELQPERLRNAVILYMQAKQKFSQIPKQFQRFTTYEKITQVYSAIKKISDQTLHQQAMNICRDFSQILKETYQLIDKKEFDSIDPLYKKLEALVAHLPARFMTTRIKLLNSLVRLKNHVLIVSSPVTSVEAQLAEIDTHQSELEQQLISHVKLAVQNQKHLEQLNATASKTMQANITLSRDSSTTVSTKESNSVNSISQNSVVSQKFQEFNTEAQTNLQTKPQLNMPTNSQLKQANSVLKKDPSFSDDFAFTDEPALPKLDLAPNPVPSQIQTPASAIDKRTQQNIASSEEKEQIIILPTDQNSREALAQDRKNTSDLLDVHPSQKIALSPLVHLRDRAQSLKVQLDAIELQMKGDAK